jgi:hypothetical protein
MRELGKGWKTFQGKTSEYKTNRILKEPNQKVEIQWTQE